MDGFKEAIRTLMVTAVRGYIRAKYYPVVRGALHSASASTAESAKRIGGQVASGAIMKARLAALGLTGLVFLTSLIVAGLVLIPIALYEMLKSIKPDVAGLLLLLIGIAYAFVPTLILLYVLRKGFWKAIADELEKVIHEETDKLLKQTDEMIDKKLG